MYRTKSNMHYETMRSCKYSLSQLSGSNEQDISPKKQNFVNLGGRFYIWLAESIYNLLYTAGSLLSESHYIALFITISHYRQGNQWTVSIRSGKVRYFTEHFLCCLVEWGFNLKQQVITLFLAPYTLLWVVSPGKCNSDNKNKLHSTWAQVFLEAIVTW